MRKSRTLDVYYKNQHVGTLAEMADRRIAFQYDREWLQTGFSISPFSLPLSNEVFVPEEKSRERFRGLFGVFADSLPDSWGELLIDRYLNSVGISRDNISSLDRLAYIGTSGIKENICKESTSQISSQFARYKSDCFAIPQVPGLNPAPAKSFSHHLKVVGYLFDLYINGSIKRQKGVTHD